jgi:hypothetical protein
MVDLAEESVGWGCEAFCIGSEFCSLEIDTAEWVRTVEAIREVFRGKLICSANWDYFEDIAFWDRLDAVAISGYFELSRETDPGFHVLLSAWKAVRAHILDWRKRKGLKIPVMFSELGYTNQDRCNMYPWDYTRNTGRDPQEQAMCHDAFIKTWKDTPELSGVFFYNWWEHEIYDRGRGCSPRGKPTEKHVRGLVWRECRGRRTGSGLKERIHSLILIVMFSRRTCGGRGEMYFPGSWS